MQGSSVLIRRISSILAVAALDSWWVGQIMLMTPTASGFSQLERRPQFELPSYGFVTRHGTAIAAKRRKRKATSDNSDDSLPDFDIPDPSSSTEGSPSTKKKEQSKSGNLMSSSQMGSSSLNEITPAMMGSSYRKETSVNDLIRDRSLESKFEFDDAEADPSLPDLAVLPNTGSDSPGKKKARQAARMAAAQKKQEEEEGGFLSMLPFILDEKGNVSAVKILENGTWLGIGLLVVWELYLNSPLFDRAQPMIPVVYDLFL